MKHILLWAVAAVAFGQQPNTPDDNYYSVAREAQVGQRFATQLQANVTTAPEPRLDQIGSRLAAHSPQFKYRFFVYDGGQPSPDTAPAAAFPADCSCRKPINLIPSAWASLARSVIGIPATP